MNNVEIYENDLVYHDVSALIHDKKTIIEVDTWTRDSTNEKFKCIENCTLKLNKSQLNDFLNVILSVDDIYRVSIKCNFTGNEVYHFYSLYDFDNIKDKLLTYYEDYLKTLNDEYNDTLNNDDDFNYHILLIRNINENETIVHKIKKSKNLNDLLDINFINNHKLNLTKVEL